MSTDVEMALVGRNGIVREGLRRILSERGFLVSASSATAAALIAETDMPQMAPDHIIVVDVGSEDPLPIIQSLHDARPQARLVALVDHFSFESMLKVFQAGGFGYIIKEISCEPLVASLQLVATGEKVLPSQLADRLPAELHAHATMDGEKAIEKAHLSQREIEILRCLITGCPNKVISRKLDISEATVKVHVKTILRKIRVNNRTQAAIWAVSCGIEGIGAGDGGIAPDRDGDPPLARQLLLPNGLGQGARGTAH